jgi:hypothetical protein
VLEEPVAETPVPTPLPLVQRLGSAGIILLAALAGIAAYFLSALLNLRL